MAWDLGKAMQKKEEFESARLADFEFRQRVRATRLLARTLGVDESSLVKEIAARDEEGVLDLVAVETSRSKDKIAAEFARCPVEARA
ncbi:MAG: hypothetical protein Q8Q79_01990 [Sphingopyxis sp.]|nr:hypothetical protein [Sphingopyxis sp.]